MTIKGAKAGQEQPRKPSIAKDSAASVSTAKILYGLAEGEVAGLVDGGKSIYLDGTPLLDSAGNPNFEGVKWDFRSGTNEQEYIQGFPDVSNEQGIGVELSSANPWIKAFTDTQLSAVRVRFKWNRLSKTNAENGDVTGYKIDYAIDLQTDGGVYQNVLTTKIEDKLSAGYERTHRIDLPKSTTGWQIRVRRITPNDPSDYVQDTMVIDAVAEVIDVKLAYPNTALLGLQYNAETFNSIAKIAVHMRGSIIRVPSNYDPVARTYTGIWDGTFKDAYSNNPAWAYYYLCTQWRFGLGDRLDATMIDKWSLYALGQYCDQMVSDGKGGLEPRFTCNVYLQKQADAYQVLQNIGGIFRAMSYWNGEKIILDADVPQDPVYTFSRANVIEGNFEYTGTRARDRHTLAKVAWDNPLNGFETEYEYIRDEKAMAKFGVKVLDLSAFGCTSQAQAQRAGLWALKTEQLETRQVAFSVGLDGVNCTVGNIINVSDELFAGRANGGRVSTVNSAQTVITLDREVTAAIGDVLIVNGGSGKSERRNITAIAGRTITVGAAFTDAEPEHVWAIETADLKLMRFRVMQISESDNNTYNVVAIQHEPQKYDAIDFGTDVKPTDITIVNPDSVDAPTSVTITSRHREVQGQTVATLVIGWSQVSGAVAYDVEWRKDDGTWIRMPRTGNTSAEIDGVYSGQYMARVRAVSAFDVQSNPTTSMLTEVQGKIGLPPTVVGLTATGILFGMDLKWGFANGSGDAAFTEIQVGSAPDVNVAPLTKVSYPTNTHTITGLQGNLSQSYRARLVDKLGFVSPWSAWVTGVTDASADKVMDLIEGQIKESSLNSILTTKIANIQINKDAISQETEDRIQAIIAANNRIDGANATFINFQEDTGNEFSAQGERLDGIVADYKPRYTDATKLTDSSRSQQWTYWKSVAQDNYATNERVTVLQSDVANSNATVTQSLNTLATKDEVLASSIATLNTTTGQNTADIASEATARTNADNALSQRVDTVQSSTATAQSKANKAETDAAAAQTAANNAATAAGNKGEVIFGSITPAAIKQLAQNLWIDTTGGKNTPKRWDGSAWSIVTDKAATDAQSAANAAQATATEALDKANTATTNIATIQTELTATTSQSSATASSVTTLQTTVGNNTASIQTQQTSIDGINLQYTVKLDSGGKISGFGLMNDGATSAFDVRADRFSISAPSDKPNDVTGTSPFMVLTNATVIDGVTVPAGVYARNFYAPRASIDTIQIKDAAIKTAQIDNLAVTTGKIANLAVDTLQIAGNAVTVPIAFYRESFTYTTTSFVEIERVTLPTSMGQVNMVYSGTYIFNTDNASFSFGAAITVRVLVDGVPSAFASGETQILFAHSVGSNASLGGSFVVNKLIPATTSNSVITIEIKASSKSSLYNTSIIATTIRK